MDQLTRLQIVCILIFLGLLAYANAVNHPFVHDDVLFIQKNPNLESLDLKNFFLHSSVPDYDRSFVNQYYRPLLELTNRILYRIVGRNPHGFHLFNILLHILNSFLVFNITSFITDNKKKLSLAAAILFLLHPVQSEAVACISGISNLLFTALCLMSFFMYLMGIHAKKTSGYRMRYMFSLLLFFFALLAKEQSVILPALIVAYELCFTKISFKAFLERFWPVAGFFIVLAGYFLLRKILYGFAVTPPMANRQEYLLILLAIPRSILTYLSLVFFPNNLHYYRSQDFLLPFIGPTLLLVGIIVLIVLLTCRAPLPQKRWMAFGLSWFGISLFPTLNIMPLINEYSLLLTSEHFLYFPIIGILLFVMGLCFHAFNGREDSKVFDRCFIICGMIVVIYMGITVKQNNYWRDEISLFERTLKFEKDFGRGRILLAAAYASAGDFQKAVEEDLKGLVIMQGYAQKTSNDRIKVFYQDFIKKIHYHLGYCYRNLDDRAASLDHYKKALELEPNNDIFQYTVGIAYLEVKDISNAVIHFEKAVDLNENNLVAMNSLAICYQETGEWAKAEKYLRLVAEKDSQSLSAKKNLENFLRKYKQ